jgi:hypothetical protein
MVVVTVQADPNRFLSISSPRAAIVPCSLDIPHFTLSYTGLGEGAGLDQHDYLEQLVAKPFHHDRTPGGALDPFISVNGTPLAMRGGIPNQLHTIQVAKYDSQYSGHR